MFRVVNDYLSRLFMYVLFFTTGKPPRDFNNQKFPSIDSLADNEKTPEVPTLLPVPMKRTSRENPTKAPSPGNQNNAATSPRGPPKPERILVSDSPTNTTIRNTVNRLFSSSSENDSELYVNVNVQDARSPGKGGRSRSAANSTSDRPPKPAGNKPSPTSPKPHLPNANEKAAAAKPTNRAVKPATLSPDIPLKQ